ncbi:hypothetical protein GCM10009416_07660 [Craurococcus roseus]|uniref:Secreted protein n=1 Tax=Craurococcus roseus TaxID=77585 RepID=A0ABP3PQU4_9PROT
MLSAQPPVFFFAMELLTVGAFSADAPEKAAERGRPGSGMKPGGPRLVKEAVRSGRRAQGMKLPPPTSRMAPLR